MDRLFIIQSHPVCSSSSQTPKWLNTFDPRGRNSLKMIPIRFPDRRRPQFPLFFHYSTTMTSSFAFDWRRLLRNPLFLDLGPVTKITTSSNSMRHNHRSLAAWPDGLQIGVSFSFPNCLCNDSNHLLSSHSFPKMFSHSTTKRDDGLKKNIWKNKKKLDVFQQLRNCWCRLKERKGKKSAWHAHKIFRSKWLLARLSFGHPFEFLQTKNWAIKTIRFFKIKYFYGCWWHSV